MPPNLLSTTVSLVKEYDLRIDRPGDTPSRVSSNALGGEASLSADGSERRVITYLRFGSNPLPSNAVPYRLDVDITLQSSHRWLNSFTYAWYWSNMIPDQSYTYTQMWNSGSSLMRSFSPSITPMISSAWRAELHRFTFSITSFPSDFKEFLRSGNARGWYMIPRITSTSPTSSGVSWGVGVIPRIGELDEQDGIPFSMRLYYYINTNPNAPQASNVITSSKTPSLTFTLSDPDDDRLTAIDVQVSRSTSFSGSNIVWEVSGRSINVSSGGTTSVTVGTQLAAGRYYYRARVKDANEAWSSWSQTYTLTVNSVPVTQVKNLVSKGYTLNQHPKLIFNVTDSDGDSITNVEVQIATSDSFANLVWSGNVSSGAFSGLPVSGQGDVLLNVPIALSPGTYYVRARAYDSISWGSYSAPVAFTVASPPWSDTIPANVTTFKAEWMNQIAEAINAARQFRGLPTVEFTDGTIIPQQHDIKAIHVAERRSALEEVLSIVGITPTWTDPDLSSADRKGIHIQELRDYLLQV